MKDITNTSATLEWTPPKKDGGSPITNYVIEYKPDTASKWLKVEDKVPACSYTVCDLVQGLNYQFRVSAENKAGVGKPSDVSATYTIKAPVGEWNTEYSRSSFKD